MMESNNQFESFLINYRNQMMLELVYVDFMSQSDVKSLLGSNDEYMDSFPMISYEETPDSCFSVSIDYSNFLNNTDLYDYQWMCICKYEEVFALMCVHDNYDTLKIDAFEVNNKFRGFGHSIKMIEGFEIAAKNAGYEKIEIEPFDLSSETYWQHMGYTRNENGGLKYVKMV